MILSKSSWHYKMHVFLYGRDSELPNNFCPYFWKTIVVGLILIGPFFLISFPMTLTFFLLRKIRKNQEPPSVSDDGYFGAYTIMGLLFNFAAFVLYCMIAMWSTKLGEKMTVIQGVGGTGYLLLIVVSCLLIWERIRERLEERRLSRRRSNFYKDGIKESKPSVIITGVKSWYKKNCPIIEWKN